MKAADCTSLESGVVADLGQLGRVSRVHEGGREGGAALKGRAWSRAGAWL